MIFWYRFQCDYLVLIVQQFLLSDSPPIRFASKDLAVPSNILCPRGDPAKLAAAAAPLILSNSAGVFPNILGLLDEDSSETPGAFGAGCWVFAWVPVFLLTKYRLYVKDTVTFNKSEES